jgi:cytochrome P450
MALLDSVKNRKGAASATPDRVPFNPFNPEFRRDPYPIYAALRAREPVKRVFGSWLVSRHADVLTVLRGRQFSSSRIPELVKRRGGGLERAATGDYDGIESFIAKAIVFTENPDHARLRRLVNNVFDGAAVAAERVAIEAIARELLTRPLADSGMEALADFADRLPMYLMCHRMGLPREMGPAMRDWAAEARMLLDPTLMAPADFARVETVVREALGYLAGVVEERKRRPGDDIISILLANRDRDDRLSEQEVALTCLMSFVAGHETTKHLIGNGILCLLRHPDQAALLRASPALAASVTEEVLRFEPPLQQTKRVAIADAEIGGVPIREGEQVLLLLASANRDEAVFDKPDRFLIARSDVQAHVGFGFGMRACLGGGLANLEATIAFELLFGGDIRIELATDGVEWQDAAVILRGLKQLPLRFSGRS